MMTAAESRIKLWIVTYHLNTGGVEEVILTYARLLDKKKFSIAVICLEEGVVSKEIAEIGEVDLIYVSTLSRLKRFIHLWSLARHYKPDIIHNHACWYGLVIGGLVGAKRVETIHNTYNWFSWHERIRYSFYLMLAHRVIAVAEEIKTFTLRSFPFMNEKKFEVIYNGVDEQKFVQAPDSSGMRSELHIPQDAPVIGFVGRLTEQKGLRYLLEAAVQLRSSSPGIYFVIVGDGELRNDLQRLSESLELSNVIFTGFHRDVKKYMCMFDALMLPSLFEGLPVTLLEAMAVGMPVIASRVGGIPEVLKDGVTGFLVEPQNVQQLVQKTEEMIKEPNKRTAMGLAAKELFTKKFSAAAMVKYTEDLYLRLCMREY